MTPVTIPVAPPLPPRKKKGGGNIYIIYIPNLGFLIAVVESKAALEGAPREHRRSTEGAHLRAYSGACFPPAIVSSHMFAKLVNKRLRISYDSTFMYIKGINHYQKRFPLIQINAIYKHEVL